MFNVRKFSHDDYKKVSVSVTQINRLDSGDMFLMNSRKIVNRTFTLSKEKSVCSNVTRLDIEYQYNRYIYPIIEHLISSFPFVYRGDSMFRVGYNYMSNKYVYLNHVHVGVIPDNYDMKSWKVINNCFGYPSFERFQRNRSDIKGYVSWDMRSVDDQYVANMVGLCNLLYINHHLSLNKIKTC